MSIADDGADDELLWRRARERDGVAFATVFDRISTPGIDIADDCPHLSRNASRARRRYEALLARLPRNDVAADIADRVIDDMSVRDGARRRTFGLPARNDLELAHVPTAHRSEQLNATRSARPGWTPCTARSGCCRTPGRASRSAAGSTRTKEVINAQHP